MMPRDRAAMRTNLMAHIQKFVYGPFDDYYKRVLSEVIEANDALLGGRLYRFRFEGKIYEQPDAIIKGVRGKVYPLFEELVPKFRAVLEEKQAIDRDERPFVTNYLQKILLRFDNTQDILINMPAVLRRPFVEFMAEKGIVPKDTNIDEAGEAVNACPKAMALLKQRLMLNLLLGDR